MTRGDVDTGAEDRLDTLATEMREGVVHYKPGQHRAYTTGERTDAILLYVDGMGHACLVPCERTDLGWIHVGVALKIMATGVRTGWRQLPKRYKLSDASRRALDDAEVVA